MALIGSMVLDRAAIAKARAIVSEPDFYRPWHQSFFRAIGALDDLNTPVDLITLTDELRTTHKLEDGMVEYLMTMFSQVPSAARVEHYANIVLRVSRERAVWNLSHSLSAMLKNKRPLPDLIKHITETIEPFDQPSKNGLFAPIDYNDMLTGELPEEPWLVADLIPEGGLALLVGDGGVGKSWVAYHMSQCVTSGAPFLGRFDVRVRPVLYFDNESGERHAKERIRKLNNGMQSLEPTFAITRGLLSVFHQPCRVEEPEHSDGLLRLLDPHPDALVVIDPLCDSFMGDENSASDWSHFFERLRRIRQQTCATFLLVHHARKESPLNSSRAGQMVRGSTAIRDAADSLIFLKLIGDSLQVEHDKSRRAQRAAPFTITIAHDQLTDTTTLAFGGESTVSHAKSLDALNWLTRTLAQADAPLHTAELDRLAELADIAPKTLRVARDNAIASGSILRDSPKGINGYLYYLPEMCFPTTPPYT